MVRREDKLLGICGSSTLPLVTPPDKKNTDHHMNGHGDLTLTNLSQNYIIDEPDERGSSVIRLRKIPTPLR
jgi:hypothetical protein